MCEIPWVSKYLFIMKKSKIKDDVSGYAKVMEKLLQAVQESDQIPNMTLEVFLEQADMAWEVYRAADMRLNYGKN